MSVDNQYPEISSKSKDRLQQKTLTPPLQTLLQPRLNYVSALYRLSNNLVLKILDPVQSAVPRI